MVRLLSYLRNPLSQDLAYSVLFALMLSELHIGACVAPPEEASGFAEEVCELFLKLLQDKKSISAAVFVSEILVPQTAAFKLCLSNVFQVS